MNNTIVGQHTVNATELRFNLGKILADLERKGNPLLIISRSKPKAWLYPYERANSATDLFTRWRRTALSKYKKIKADNLIAIIRKDRER